MHRARAAKSRVWRECWRECRIGIAVANAPESDSEQLRKNLPAARLCFAGMHALRLKNARREFLRAHRGRVGGVRAANPDCTRAKRLRLRIGASSCKDGRFLNVDPIIGNPANSQSLNPYSYIGNNPLSGTDPTGYEAVIDSCTAATGSHICGVSTAAGNSTVSGHETTTDPSTGKTTTTTFTGTLNGNQLTSAVITSVSSGSVSQGAKGPGGQNTQNVDSTVAGNPNASSNGVQSTGLSLRPTSTHCINNCEEALALEGVGVPHPVDPNEGMTLSPQGADFIKGYEAPHGVRLEVYDANH